MQNFQSYISEETISDLDNGNTTYEEMINRLSDYPELVKFFVEQDGTQSAKELLAYIIGFTISCFQEESKKSFSLSINMLQQFEDMVTNEQGELASTNFFENFEPHLWQVFVDTVGSAVKDQKLSDNEIVMFGRVFGSVLMCLMTICYDTTRLKAMKAYT
jgi:hypothetical protein